MRRVAAILFSAVFLAGCATLPPKASEEPLTGTEILASLRAAEAAGDLNEVRLAGMRFLGRRSDDAIADEVRLLVAAADTELGFYGDASDLLQPIVFAGRGDANEGRALALLARVHAADGDFEAAAGHLLRALSTPIDGTARAAAEASLAGAAALVDAEALDRLTQTHAGRPGLETLTRERLSRAYAAGDSAAVRSLGEVLETSDETGPAGSVLRIGLICPLAGRYAPLGEAFLHGAAIAAGELRRRGLTGIELVAADTRGDPLSAYRAVRRLVEEESVIAVIGGVLSSSTIAAAQAAQCAGAVLFSPVATARGIGSIGEWIFQASGGEEIEETAVARLACGTLDARRVAFIAADNERSRRAAVLFRAEVERAGGELVAVVLYDEGSSDFREPIEAVRRAAPEALFLASETEDLFLLLPQFSFYEFGVQLLGTSAWNSRRLLRMAAKDMEGAIFPVETAGVDEAERFRVAVELLDRPDIESNPFTVGGYVGVETIVDAAVAAGRGGESLRREMERALEHRLHPYLELASKRGVAFRTVRDEHVVEFRP
ncbi:MAG: ABC transporter substrate-binding protein [Candidatus Krumholzibacteriota bacterium]|nr:ABC transporter substrate-binding protein [Candidatus Krumholzibacteriota bacterium]